MTIKSFKEQSQVNEGAALRPFLKYQANRVAMNAVPAGGIIAKGADVISKSKKPSRSSSKTNTAYSPTAPSAKGQREDVKGEGYSSFAQQKAVWANRKDGGKGHPDNKKKSKKEGVDEISRDDMVKKVSSTIGSKAPMMINPQNKEKNKIKTGLDRLRKALGPNHAMNKSRA